MDGISINLPEPTYLDSWIQFFKNMSQMVLIVVIVLYAGILVEEYSKNTIQILRTKGLKSYSVILGKFITGSLILFIGYLVGVLVNILYTWIYFKETLNSDILIGIAGLFLFYVLLISLFIFWGSLMKKLSGVFLTSLGFLGILFLVNIKDSLKKFNPISLLGLGGDLISGGVIAKDYIWSFVITLALIVIFLVTGIFFFRKKEL